MRGVGVFVMVVVVVGEAGLGGGELEGGEFGGEEGD